MTTSPPLTWVSRTGARDWRAPAAEPGRAAFHRSLPGYQPTPLAEIPELAAALGVARVFVKDESDRLGLPAFKILGASWAIERALWPDSPSSGHAPAVSVLVAATEGSHGRARLGITPASTIVLLSTESSSANPIRPADLR